MTVTHGRDGHLRRQRVGLAAGPPDVHVVVGMGETPRLPPLPALPTTVVSVANPAGGLPLAGARNTGAEVALRAGADVLVFLDVDCIPVPALVSRYRDVATTTAGPAVLCGAVGYLPPPGGDGYPVGGPAERAPLHPGRPSPAPGTVATGGRWDLFWSLSFAVTAGTWRLLGGFDDRFVGYGAEDTDLAVRAEAAGARLLWVGGAEAYHQFHPPARDDRRRAAELLANARRFHDLHGWWPMRDWLTELAARGWIRWTDGG